MENWFIRVHDQLAAHGYVARHGQMVDATFVSAPRQRNRREENAQIKAGQIPTGWPVAKARQQDVEARWVKKNEETHYGYKNHLNADVAYKLIQDYAVTDAAVHDSQVIDQLRDYTKPAEGTTRPVYADRAYRSQERDTPLATLPSRAQFARREAVATHGRKHRSSTIVTNLRFVLELNTFSAPRTKWEDTWYALLE